MRIQNASRWVIFIADIVFSVMALFSAYLIRFDFFSKRVINLETELYILKTALIPFIVIRGIIFLRGKTYAGIIRYSSTEDFRRIIVWVGVGTIILSVGAMIRYYFIDGYLLLPRSVIAIEFFLTIAYMSAFRVFVKVAYYEGKKESKPVKKVILYGAGEMGHVTLMTLKKDLSLNYEIIGFVDDSHDKIGQNINGIKIYHSSKLLKLLRRKKADALIVSIANPNKRNSRRIADICIHTKTEMLVVPPLDKWVNGEFNVSQIQKIKIEDLLGRKEINLGIPQLNDFIKDKVVLITGAAGSIGSEILRQVQLYSPMKVIALDQSESSLYDVVNDLDYVEGVESVICDITNEKRLEKVFIKYKPQIVFHAAAYKHVPLMENNPCEAILTNVYGSKLLVDFADKFNVDEFIMISTDKAVNPTNVMGASKRIAEIITQSKSLSHTKYTITRFGNVLGSNGSVIPLFKKQIESGGPVTVTHPDITRYFMTIPEACQLVLEAATMGKGGEIFVFDMGESVKIIDLAKKMIILSGFEPEVEIPIKITGLRPGEKLYEELLSNDENTIKTHHEQIMIAKVSATDWTMMHELIQKMILFAKEQDNLSAVQKMKEIVPEYISNNSVFSTLDN